MLTDALAQYLIWKQWRRWLLVVGSHPEDQLLADAYRRSAKKFGAKIVDERVYKDTGGGRRSDSGSVQVQRQMPVFTQNAPDLRRARRGRRKRRFRRLSALSHLGSPAGRRLRGLAADKLGPLARVLGRRAVAEPLRASLQARDECARQSGLGRHAPDRRRRRAHQISRPQDDPRRHSVAGLRARRLQGTGAYRARLEPAAASADPAHRRQGHGLGFAAGRFPASDVALDTLGLDRPETKCKLH